MTESTKQQPTSTVDETAAARALAEREGRLAAYAGEDKVIPSSEMRALLAEQTWNQVRFFSHIPALDRAVGGFEGGELIVISGPTKNGKSLLGQTLTSRFHDEGINALWFSFEVPVRQFLKQLPETCEFYLPSQLVPYKPEWLDDRILESKLKHNSRAVFIDHLHFLIDIERAGRGNFSLDIGTVVRKLKRMAIRYNVVVFLMAHATKGLDASGLPRDLEASDVRDSSFIAQEADSTWIIQRMRSKEDKTLYTHNAVLKICNHRRTGVMGEKIYLTKPEGRSLFEPLDAGENQQLEAFDGRNGNDALRY